MTALSKPTVKILAKSNVEARQHRKKVDVHPLFILVDVHQHRYRNSMNIVSVNDLACCIKQARKNLGWTQAELAERSGVSRDWIIGLERAKPGVELVLVLRTLKALNLPLSIDPRSPKRVPSEGVNLEDVLNNTRSHDNRL